MCIYEWVCKGGREVVMPRLYLHAGVRNAFVRELWVIAVENDQGAWHGWQAMRSNHVKTSVCPYYPSGRRVAASKQAITPHPTLEPGKARCRHARDTRPDRRVYKPLPAPNLPSPNLLKNVPLFLSTRKYNPEDACLLFLSHQKQHSPALMFRLWTLWFCHFWFKNPFEGKTCFCSFLDFKNATSRNYVWCFFFLSFQNSVKSFDVWLFWLSKIEHGDGYELVFALLFSWAEIIKILLGWVHVCSFLAA